MYSKILNGHHFETFKWEIIYIYIYTEYNKIFKKIHYRYLDSSLSYILFSKKDKWSDKKRSVFGFTFIRTFVFILIYKITSRNLADLLRNTLYISNGVVQSSCTLLVQYRQTTLASVMFKNTPYASILQIKLLALRQNSMHSYWATMQTWPQI